MTTFQALVYAILHGFTTFLPISSDAHHFLAPYAAQWPAASGPLLGALSLGALLALLAYFIHDWASMISCFLQVVIFRKKPMTLDERLPLFLAIATGPLGILAFYVDRGSIALPLPFEWTPLTVAGALALFGLPLWFADSMNRRNKSMFDWNWIDCVLVGILQLVAYAFIGFGALTASLTVALFRNYHREAAGKFSLFTLMPILLVQTIVGLRMTSFHSGAPGADLSWLSFGVALVVTFFTSLLVIGGFMKQLQRKGFGQYVVYRWVAAAAVVALYFYRQRNG